jgi:hypothetical protein
MKWSWRIGEFAGIGVHDHATFLLLIGWIAFGHWETSRSVAATIVEVGFLLAIFGCQAKWPSWRARRGRPGGTRLTSPLIALRGTIGPMRELER